MTAMYDESGNIQSVLENGSGQKIVFKKKATIQKEHDRNIASAFAIEMAISTLINRRDSAGINPMCDENSPFPCVVEAPCGR
ncbi:hypothetical protein LXA47_08930 [Massilia sp. P8910]|nr:hypothetical protein [Massilia antarctica]